MSGRGSEPTNRYKSTVFMGENMIMASYTNVKGKLLWFHKELEVDSRAHVLHETNQQQGNVCYLGCVW
jgi:hypothetical protein